MRKSFKMMIIGLCMFLTTSVFAYAQEIKNPAHVLIEAQNENIKVGETIKYEIYFSLMGLNQSYDDITLSLDLADALKDPNITFEQDLSELEMFGHTPVYDDVNHVLTWLIQDSRGGIEINKILELKTRNGVMPLNDSFAVDFSFSTEGYDVQKSSSVVNLEAKSNMSVKNNFKGILANGEFEKIYTLRHLDESIFGMGVSVNAYTSGALKLKEGSEVLYVVEMPDGFVYQSNTSGVEPIIDGQRLTWIFDASIGADDDFYLNIGFDLHVSMVETLPFYKKANFKAYAQIEFVDGSIGDLSAVSSTLISPNEHQEKPDTGETGAFAPALRGPVNHYGGTGDSGNADVEVDENALLAWNLRVTALTSNNNDAKINQMDYFYYPDVNTDLIEFYSGDFYYYPNSNTPSSPMTEDVFYSFSVMYEGDSEWTHLVPVIEVATTYTAESLGLDSSRKVEMVWLHFHDNQEGHVFVDQTGYHIPEFTSAQIPAGIFSSNIKFYHKIDKGYIGTLKSDAGYFTTGFDYSHYLRIDHGGRLPEGTFDPQRSNALDERFDAYVLNKTAKVISIPEGVSRVVQTKVSLNDGDSSVISRDNDNILRFTIRNDKSSINSLEGPFVSYALVDEGLSLDLSSQVKGGTVTLVEENHQGSSQNLYRLEFDVKELRPNLSAQIAIPVSIKNDASYKMNVKLINYLDESFDVYQVENSDGTITKKGNETFDFNQDGIENEVYYTSKNFSYRNAYEFYGENLISVDDGGFSEYSNIHEGQDLKLQINLGNPKEKSVSSFTLVNVLPTIGDTYVINDIERESTFTLKLEEFIEVDESKYQVFYSESDEPALSSFIDRNQNSKLPSSINTSIIEEKAWLTKDEVEDLSLIRSFAILKTEDTAYVKASEISFIANLHIESDITQFNSSVDERIAYNTFAFAMNDSSVLEVTEAYVVLVDKPEDTYTVYFNSHGGTEVENISNIKPNSYINEPVKPSKVGYNFAGWYLDETYDQHFIFDEMIIFGNMTLHAKWVKVSDVPVDPDVPVVPDVPLDPDDPNIPVNPDKPGQPDDSTDGEPNPPVNGVLPSTGISPKLFGNLVLIAGMVSLSANMIIKKLKDEKDKNNK